MATKDFHVDPGGHFAEQPDYVDTWPRHCVAGTAGADFHPELDTTAVDAVFLKGRHSAAYSGFEGTDDSGTALADWLRDIERELAPVAVSRFTIKQGDAPGGLSMEVRLVAYRPAAKAEPGR